jgi:methionyl-tRNA formyltransferase
MQKINIAFFGTSGYSVIVLEHLKRANLTPSLIVATPDKPAGRGMMLTPPPTKIWAEENNVPVVQPEKLRDPAFVDMLKSKNFDVFVVVAYGKIIPQEIIDIPPHGALNIHASLLPKFRGASPIESAILADEKNTGVTIMKIDAEMDHGPIVATREIVMPQWPATAPELGTALVEAGSNLLVEILPQWIAGKIEAVEQDHSQATYTKKIEKSDGEIDLTDDPYKNFLKIQAFHKWPTAFFFIERHPSTSSGQAGKKMRVIIRKAQFNNGQLEILRVVPEGKREMNFKDFLKLS